MSNAVSVSPEKEIQKTLEVMKPEFAAVLPSDIPVDKFVRVVKTALLKDGELLKCDRKSFFEACLHAAKDHLIPDGKEAAFVSFKGIVQYLPMVGGILKKIRKSGKIKTISSQVVFEKDSFKFSIEDGVEKLTHEPNVFLKDRGAAVGVYAVAITNDGGVYYEVMSLADIEAVRKSSRSAHSNYSPWQTFPGEMWKKTAIRRLSKRLPMSTDVEQTFEYDNQDYEYEEPVVVAPNSSRLRTLITKESNPVESTPSYEDLSKTLDQPQE